MYCLRVLGALWFMTFWGMVPNLIWAGEPLKVTDESVTLVPPVDIQRISFLGVLDFQLYSKHQETIDTPDLVKGLGALQNDEISRLLKTSQSSKDSAGWFNGLGSGLGLIGAGLIVASSNADQTTGWGLFLGGVGLRIAGSFSLDQADTSMFNAVEKSNRIYWKQMADTHGSKPISGLLPIHSCFSTLNGFEYECAGKKLGSDSDFKTLFVKSNDFEVQHQFSECEANGTTGSVLAVIGGAGCLGSAVGYFSTADSNDKTACVWGFAFSAVVGMLGELFLKGAESAKFNAVQRYNRFALGQEAVLPQGPKDEKDLLNFSSPGPGSDKNP